MPICPRTRIGNVLISLGYCTPAQVKEGARHMNGTRRLGDVLIELEHVSERQLEWALICQSMENKETNGSAIYTFAKKQRTGLVDDLKDITTKMRALTAKINAKG